MKKVFLLLLISSTLTSGAQDLHLSETFLMPGDTLFGTAYFSNPELLGYAYYVSLFDASGRPIRHQLTPVTQAYLHFSMPLSDSLTAGRYLLEIINYQNTVPSHVQWVQIGPLNGEGQSPSETLQASKSELDLKLSMQKDSAQIDFQLPFRDGQNVAISIRDAAQHPSDVFEKCDLQNHHSLAHRGLNDYLKGFELSGQVVDPNGHPVAGKKVLMTMVKQDRESPSFTVLSTKTTSSGAFNFVNLNATGKYMAYFNMLDTAQMDIRLTPPKQDLLVAFEGCVPNPITSGWDHGAIRLRQLNKQVLAQYSPTQKKPAWNPVNRPILPHSDQVTDLNDYVSFASVDQMIKEAVKFLYFKQKKLQVFSPELKRTHEGTPVTLLNGIPVTQDALLNLDPANIRFVEIAYKLRTLASYGSFAKGGVISFVTRNKVSQRVVSTLLAGYEKPVTEHRGAHPPQAPYFPSLLLWQADLVGNQATYNVRFKLPAYPTAINVCLSAIDSANRVYFFTKTFQIKRQ